LTERTVALNVVEHGAGALNIGASQILTEDNLNGGAYAQQGSDRHDGSENWRYKRQGGAGGFTQPSGRWPPNLVLLEGVVANDLDKQSGMRKSGGYPPEGGSEPMVRPMASPMCVVNKKFGPSEGGASRFFRQIKP